LHAGELARDARALRRAAAGLAGSPGSERHRETIRGRVNLEPGKVVWKGTPSFEVPFGPGTSDAWRTWAARLRAVNPEDTALIEAAYLGASVTLGHFSQGHVALSASRDPGWPGPAPVGTDLYGRLLVHLAEQLGRSAARLGEERVIRCRYCQEPVLVARWGRKRYCSAAHRWAARNKRKRAEAIAG
jgi:hypothetical protein